MVGRRQIATDGGRGLSVRKTPVRGIPRRPLCASRGARRGPRRRRLGLSSAASRIAAVSHRHARGSLDHVKGRGGREGRAPGRRAAAAKAPSAAAPGSPLERRGGVGRDGRRRPPGQGPDQKPPCGARRPVGALVAQGVEFLEALPSGRTGGQPISPHPKWRVGRFFFVLRRRVPAAGRGRLDIAGRQGLERGLPRWNARARHEERAGPSDPSTSLRDSRPRSRCRGTSHTPNIQEPSTCSRASCEIFLREPKEDVRLRPDQLM